MSISTEYPVGFIFLCIALGAAAAWLLYAKARDLQEASLALRRSMAALRFVSVTLLAILILAPLVERRTTQAIRPVVVLAQDNSASLLLSADSSYLRGTWPQLWRDFARELGKDFDVRMMRFGQRAHYTDSLSFDDNYSDYDQALQQVIGDFASQNLGAVVIAGDGLYNRGMAPQYRALQMGVPVYTLAQGDTTPQRDLRLRDVVHNATVFVEASLPIEVYYEAFDLPATQTVLTVSEKGKVLLQKEIAIKNKYHSGQENLQVQLLGEGTHLLEIALQPVAGELQERNNRRTIAVQVIEKKERILLLTAASHPDVGALKNALESNPIYEVEVWHELQNLPQLQNYKVAILFQLPAPQLPAAQLKKLVDSPTALFFIVGSNTNLPLLNQHNGLLSIQSKGSTNMAEAVVAPNFGLFTTDGLAAEQEGAPPVLVPFGEYQVRPQAEVLLTQRIKGVATAMPLLALGKKDQQKQAVWVAEGLWRQRMDAYRKDNNHRRFDQLVNKVVQYLGTRELKDQLTVRIAPVVQEGSPVWAQAELYNESFELVNSAALQLQVSDSLNRLFDYLLEPYGNKYRLDLGKFPVGQYRWTARAELAGKSLVRQGQFVVVPTNIEASNTVADFELLQQLAATNQARSYAYRQLDSLAQALRADARIRSVLTEQQRLTNVSHLKILFFLLLLSLSVEWVLRKYFGSY